MPHDLPIFTQPRLSRREALGAGLALGAFLLPRSVSAFAASSATRRKAKSVIVVLLEGGMSHIDTLDPKPKAPAELRGEFGTIPTSVSNLRFGEHLPLLARQAHIFNVVRSVHSSARCHSPGLHWILTGYDNPDVGTDRTRVNLKYPSQGSIIAHQMGATSSRRVPRFVALPRRSQIGGLVTFTRPTFLGAACEAFETGEPPHTATESMRLPPNLLMPKDMPWERLTDRRGLMTALDQLKAAGERGAVLSRMDPHHARAFQILTGQSMATALDISREPSALRERYGGNRVGQSLLLARRLVEAGVTYLLVNTAQSNDWDTHGNNFGMLKNKLLPPLDRAVSTLLVDLHQRGMLDDTLVLMMGEMGRTPTINNQAGRDHWPDAYSVVLAGGGLTRGQVLGSTTAAGHNPGVRPVPVSDLLATVYHQLGIDPQSILYDEQNRPIPILPAAKPIHELIA